MSDVLIRQATLNDIPALLRHRQGMYENMGYNDPVAMSAMVSTCKPYLAAALANGTLRGWLACAGEQVVAGGPGYSIQIRDWKTGSDIASGGFSFTPPPGARRVDVADLATLKDMSDLPSNFRIGDK